MMEARIILPVADNSGAPLDRVHALLAKHLCHHFGGVTVTDTRGMWVGGDGTLYDEPGRAYDVAMVNNSENAFKLRNTALHFGKMAGQEAMYVRYASGEVDILNTLPAIAA